MLVGYMSAQELVIFDLETTGLSPAGDEIIQIAAMRMVDGRAIQSDTFFSYVNPVQSIPPWISFYTGITEKDVRNAPPIGPVLRDFSQFVGGATLIAHNGHRFDMRFLAASCQRYQLNIRPVPYYDSLGLSWILWGRQGYRHGLDDLVNRLGISPTGVRRHDARGDVHLLAQAVEKMWEQVCATYGQPNLELYHGVLPLVAAA